jgi:hypothetical protein
MRNALVALIGIVPAIELRMSDDQIDNFDRVLRRADNTAAQETAQR